MDSTDSQRMASSSEGSRDYETSSSGDDLEKSLLWPEERRHSSHGFREAQARKSRILRSSVLWLTVSNVGLFVLSGLMLWSSRTQARSDQETWKAMSYFSPILERFDIPKISVVTNGTLYDTNPPSILRMRTGDEADAEWHRIGDHVWPLIISADDVRALGKDPEVAVRIPEELGYGSDAYIAQTEVFHHLHCLDMLRRETNYAHYYEEKERPFPGGAQHQAHIGHCFDVLAQAIKCTGSVDMITFNWVEEWDQPFPDFANHKVCRDFDALLEWVNANAMESEVFQKMKSPPPGYAVLPAPGPAL
ncbi:hypothetical protein DL767_003764 [Monosporascus sp. MG133]|nr:hypothetical protein DL767_003764 [Monosporascus sp. MG133]